MSKKTLILPKGLDYRELQEAISANPELASVLSSLEKHIRTASPKEIEIILRKLGIVDYRYTLGFKDFIECAITPYHPDMGELYDIHLEWINIIEVQYPEDNVMIFAPIDSWKSTILAVNYPLYLQYLTNNIRIGIFSEAEDLSSKRVVQQRTVIEKNPVINKLGIKRPVNAVDWGKLSYTIDRTAVLSDSTVSAYGVNAATQGHKIDVGILDDICSIKNSSTSTNRKNLKAKMRREVFSRLTKVPPKPLVKSRFIGIGTALHSEDLNHELVHGFPEDPTSEALFKEFRFKALYDGDDIEKAPEFVKKQVQEHKYLVVDSDGLKRPIGLLFPERLTMAFLMEQKNKGQGAKFFAQNYQQEARTDEESIIQYQWVVNCFEPRLDFSETTWRKFIPSRGSVIFSLDPAIVRSAAEAKKKNTDFWVMQVCYYDSIRDKRIILDARRGRGNEIDELIEIGANLFNQFVPLLNMYQNPYRWVIENTQGQDFLVQYFEKFFGKSRVEGVPTTFVSKNSGFTGMPVVAYAFERGAYIFPTGCERSKAYAALVAKEASEWPWGSKDDTLMTQLIQEQGITKFITHIRNLNPDLLGRKTRGPSNFSPRPPRRR